VIFNRKRASVRYRLCVQVPAARIIDVPRGAGIGCDW
jgi:hypothetical protein